MKDKKSCIVYIPFRFDSELQQLQNEEWLENDGRQKFTKADQIIRLAQLGLQTLKTTKL